MSDHEVFRGTRLAPGEAVVWRGKPGVRAVARGIVHLRLVGAYFALLFAVDFAQAWEKGLSLPKAVHDSVPLAVLTLGAAAILAALAWLMARTTRYTVTDRRVILQYGMALPATLSLPFSQVAGVAVAMGDGHEGDIALTLKPGNRMPFLKLWPLARPWHLSSPQPMLRLVPRAAVVGGLLVRAVQAAEQARLAEGRQVVVETVTEAVPETMIPQLLSA